MGVNYLNRTYNMTPEQWEQIQEIELPPGFVWEQDDNAFGIQTTQPLWWHWFQYTLEDNQNYPRNTVWYHKNGETGQHQVATIEDTLDAAHYMAAKIWLGMYE